MATPRTTTGRRLGRRLWPLSGLVPPLGLLVAIWLALIKNRRRLATLTLLMTLAASCLYGYFIWQNAGSNNYTYRYKTLSAATITLSANPAHSPIQVNAPSATVNIQKPPELLLAAGSAGTNLSHYSHQLSGQTIANFAVQNETFSGSYGKAMESWVGTNLKTNPSSTTYKAVTGTLIAYVQNFLPQGYKINLGSPQNFTNSHIKNGAWEFTVTANKTTSPQTVYQKWQGKLLYVWTSTHSYYVLLDSIQQNWQTNQATWQQMIDSLQVS
ncbi:MAG: hypothetical protein ACREGG_03365 [Candidatus Saccharimonadales bacterium]